ncbi:MAG: hypothetical protein ABIJ05_05315 [Patescibacteria group bacterium]
MIKKKKYILKLLICIGIFLALVFSSFLIYKNISSYRINSSSYKFVDWNNYKNKKYSYSFNYPKDVIINFEKNATDFWSKTPDNMLKSAEIKFPGFDNESIYINASDDFAQIVNFDQWQKINVFLNGNKTEAYKNKRVKVDFDKLWFRFTNRKGITVDFIFNYKGHPENLYKFFGIISSFKFD